MIAFTVDVEQWNCRLLGGDAARMEDDVSLSRDGVDLLLDLFGHYNILATFFVTGGFAEREPHCVRKILAHGHEVGCHGNHHIWRGNRDLDIQTEVRQSKEILQNILQQAPKGFRAPQMQYSKALLATLHNEGFLYDSSLHPTYIPGAYNHLTLSCHPFYKENIVEIPVAVSRLRLPVNWLFMRLFGAGRTIRSCKTLHKRDIVPVLYFHAWEMVEISDPLVPLYYRFRTGSPFVKDIQRLLHIFGKETITLGDLASDFVDDRK